MMSRVGAESITNAAVYLSPLVFSRKKKSFGGGLVSLTGWPPDLDTKRRQAGFLKYRLPLSFIHCTSKGYACNISRFWAESATFCVCSLNRSAQLLTLLSQACQLKPATQTWTHRPPSSSLVSLRTWDRRSALSGDHPHRRPHCLANTLTLCVFLDVNQNLCKGRNKNTIFYSFYCTTSIHCYSCA